MIRSWIIGALFILMFRLSRFLSSHHHVPSSSLPATDTSIMKTTINRTYLIMATTIFVSGETKELLRRFGSKGETYDQIIRRLIEIANDATAAEERWNRILSEDEFISAEAPEIPDEIVELLAGYLSNAYRRYSREQIAEFYLKGEPAITIMAPADYRELKSEMGHKM